MKTPQFTGRMKMADIIASNHNLILLLPRLGIPLGFGDKRVDEICRDNQADTDFVLMILNVCAFPDYLPDSEVVADTNMEGVVPFLKESHRYYHDKLPHIGDHLHHIADQMDARYGQILKKFFDDYQKEIMEHFRYEEEVIFPYLQRLRQGDCASRQKLSRLDDSHEGIEDTLADLTQIVYKYLPGNVMPEESIDMVFDILQLSADFEKHYRIEEKIVMPYISWLERGRK